MKTDMNQAYEPIDLYSCYEPKIEFPPEFLNQWGDSDEDSSPFSSTVLQEIGGTLYQVETECGGTERLAHKVKRLIFSESEVGCR